MQKVFFTQELCPSPQETPTGFYLGASILKNSPLKPLTFPPIPLYLLFASAPFIKPVPSMPHSRYLHQSIHQNTGTAIPAQGWRWDVTTRRGFSSKHKEPMDQNIYSLWGTSAQKDGSWEHSMPKCQLSECREREGEASCTKLQV